VFAVLSAALTSSKLQNILKTKLYHEVRYGKYRPRQFLFANTILTGRKDERREASDSSDKVEVMLSRNIYMFTIQLRALNASLRSRVGCTYNGRFKKCFYKVARCLTAGNDTPGSDLPLSCRKIFTNFPSLRLHSVTSLPDRVFSRPLRIVYGRYTSFAPHTVDCFRLGCW
jgi:hypothetical protein